MQKIQVLLTFMSISSQSFVVGGVDASMFLRLLSEQKIMLTVSRGFRFVHLIFSLHYETLSLCKFCKSNCAHLISLKQILYRKKRASTFLFFIMIASFLALVM